jgi:hypothetical protein
MTARLQNETAWQSATPQKAIVKPLTLRRLVLRPPLGLTPLTQRRGNKVGLCLCLGVDISLSYLLYYYYYSLLLFIVHHYYYSLLFILIFPLANGDRYSLAASQHVHVGYKPMINWHIEFAVSRARATQCMEVI